MHGPIYVSFPGRKFLDTFQIVSKSVLRNTQMQFPRTDKHEERIRVALSFRVPQFLVTPGLTYRQAHSLSKYEPIWLMHALV